jgi:hypothetical protein
MTMEVGDGVRFLPRPLRNRAPAKKAPQILVLDGGSRGGLLYIFLY